MSRQLPARPNLEYLRKQAKDLLVDLQKENRKAQLADAQHALARQYGFASWAQLKTFVESLTAAPRDDVRRAAIDESPFAGVWIANVSRSKRHPLNQYQAATIQFAVVGNAVTIDDVVVDASGGSEQTRNTLQADAVERSSGGRAVMARWRGPRLLEVVVQKDGRIEGRVVYEISTDGRTLTITTSEQVAVFERAS